MRARLSQKILPLALCFAVGVALAGAGRPAMRPDSELRESAAAGGGASSRTWLVVRSRPRPIFAETRNAKSGDHFVHLRAKFGADGVVSDLVTISSNMSDDSVVEAINAARRITFTPATEDGRPLPVLAEIRYGVGGMHATGVRGDGRRFCIFAAVPLEPSVNIVSVAGANDSEGWRVVYE